MKKERDVKKYVPVLMAVLLGVLGVLCLVLQSRMNTEPTGSVEDVSGNFGSTETVTLHYYVWEDEEFYARKIVDSYNATHPYVQVELSVPDNYDDCIDDLVLSGDAVDVFDIRGISPLVKYQSEGILTDMTELLQERGTDITAYGNIFSNIMIDGRCYAMPCRSTCWALIYNRKLFDEAGLDDPGQITWDEYRELAIRLTGTAKNGEKIYGGLIVPWDLNLLGVQHENYLYDDDLTYVQKSLERINTFMNLDQSHVTLEEFYAEGFDYLEAFENGRIAMMPMGEWFVGMILNDEESGKSDADWDVAPMPIDLGMADGTTWGQYQFIGISNQSAHAEEAFDFVTYVAGKLGAEIYAANGMLSAYSDQDVLDIYKGVVGNRNVEVFYNSFRVLEVSSIPQYGDLQNAFSERAHAYLYGQSSLDEAMELFCRDREQIFRTN